LAKQLETYSALLLAEIGLECQAVDVKDHSLLLLRIVLDSCVPYG
jgi:hypothetical protein